ncbi:hypothetical protein [Aeromicrobium sp. IC_218]|uniref:hypothetical protein n=1 Tax=Aeromicrobium sp. IC_218 TaxID=2545468 RepID=UPI00104093CF|nr:hypothetical protein [Aeromicrobium sp. IC_218]TCJ00841.1 hypothetical protein E0W78_01830 [Aeromicrobium sp. IC_218]
MSEPETPSTTTPSPDEWAYRYDRLIGAILLCTLAIIATVIVTGVVVVQRVDDAAAAQDGWSADEVELAIGRAESAADDASSVVTDLEARLEEERERESRVTEPPAAATALMPVRVTSQRADLGEAVNLGDVRIASGWELRTVRPATEMTDASMQLENIRVSITRARSALSSVSFELRDADGRAVGTGWCYAPPEADTQPEVWCQPFAVTGKPVVAKVGGVIRS